jgi:hypothetical protein
VVEKAAAGESARATVRMAVGNFMAVVAVAVAVAVVVVA